MDKNFIQFLVISYGNIEFPKNVVSLFQGKMLFKGPQCTDQQENHWTLYTAAVISSGKSKLHVDLNFISEYGIYM